MKKLMDRFGTRITDGSKVIVTNKKKNVTKVVSVVSLGSKHLVVDWRKKDQPRLVKVNPKEVVVYERVKPKQEVLDPQEWGLRVGQRVRLLPRGSENGHSDKRFDGAEGRIIDLLPNKAVVLIGADQWGGDSSISPVWPIDRVEMV